MNINDALKLHQSGRFEDAERAYRQILAAEPRHYHALHFYGVLRAQGGDMQGSVELVKRSLEINPGDPVAHMHLAEAYRALNEHAKAAAHYGRSAALKPDFAEAHAGRAMMLIELRQWREALDAASRALALRGDLLDAQIASGLSLHQLDRPGEALAAFDRAIAMQPGLAQLHYFRGNTLAVMGRNSDAVAAFDAALAIEPDAIHVLTNRGDMLRTLERFAEALADCDKVLARDPKSPLALNNRGLALMGLNRLEEALTAFDRAVAVAGMTEAHFNRSSCLILLRRYGEAVAALDLVVAREPRHARAHFNRAQALYALDRLGESRAAYDAALALEPDDVKALMARSTLLLKLKQFAAARADAEHALAVKPDLGVAASALAQWDAENCAWSGREAQAADLKRRALAGEKLNVFALLSLFDEPEIHRKAAESLAVEVLREPPGFAPHGKLRLAYFSADFRNHPVSLQAAELFERHDRSRFETFGISLKSWPEDPVRQRMRSAFDHFVDADQFGDEELARWLHAQEIDICVDLTGYTDDSRTQVLAQRPCPLAVTYLGYPGTLGARYIDYIVADAVTIPPENECFFSEKVVRLPGSFMPIDRTGRGEISASRAQEGLPEDAVVFCAFANAYKIGPEVFAVWLRLLKEIEGSVLWLSVAKPEARTNLLAEAARQAIAAERIVFARFINERSQHLARVGLADLYLDTPVYGGHSTATDLLWAGVPVVTCRGNSFGARVAASLLTVADTPELIAASLAEYETIARELARGAERRAALKGRILAGRSRLFDTERLCRSLELAYETMKQHRLSGRHESFSVAT